jgi:uncharacterized protein with HEPN domain
VKKSDLERLRKVLRTWEDLKRQIKRRNITRDELLNDEYTQWAVTTPLYNIGEQVFALSSDFKAAYPDIPWNVVSGLRHRLVHDYEGINWTIIADVVFGEMDEFTANIKLIESDLEKRENC